MQSLDIISVNLWQILISLANLLIIFTILKRFLFKPVQKVVADRQAQVESINSDKNGLLLDAMIAGEKLEQES